MGSSRRDGVFKVSIYPRLVTFKSGILCLLLLHEGIVFSYEDSSYASSVKGCLAYFFLALRYFISLMDRTRYRARASFGLEGSGLQTSTPKYFLRQVTSHAFCDYYKLTVSRSSTKMFHLRKRLH